MAKATEQNKSKAISKRADWKEDASNYAAEKHNQFTDWGADVGQRYMNTGLGVAKDTAIAAGVGAGVGASIGGTGGAITGMGGASLPLGLMGAAGGAAVGGSIGAMSGWGHAVYNVGKSLFSADPVKAETESKALISSIVNNEPGLTSISSEVKLAAADQIFNSIKDGTNITPIKIGEIIGATPEAVKTSPLSEALVRLADRVNKKVSAVYFQPIKPPVSTDPSTTPSSKPAPQLPQADRGSPIEALSHKLVDRLYLAAPQSTWTPELDKAFREFIDAGTGTKTMSSGADWNTAAPTLGFKPGLSGALAAVTSLMDKVATKPFTESPAATTGTPEAAKPAAPEVAQDTLPAILSVMRQEKMIGTHGADLVNEVKRINVLIEAAGGVNNAAIVLHRQDPSLSAALPPKLDGPLTPEFVRRNKALFQSIQGAVNKVIAKQFGPLMPHDKEKAISKLREGLKSAAVQDQWVKLASQRKDRIRSEVAAEMTVADKITARRIKARESV